MKRGSRPDAPSVAAPDHGVSFGEATRFWIKLGFINFGGPTGRIAIMHDEIVERRRWVSNARFLHALNYCMLLPGRRPSNMRCRAPRERMHSCAGTTARYS